MKPFRIDEDNCLWLVVNDDETSKTVTLTLVAQYLSDEAVEKLLPVAVKVARKCGKHLDI